jgi:hypothetical protein
MRPIEPQVDDFHSWVVMQNCHGIEGACAESVYSFDSWATSQQVLQGTVVGGLQGAVYIGH